MAIQWMDNFQGYTDRFNMLEGSPWGAVRTDPVADPDPNAPVDSRVLQMTNATGGPFEAQRLICTTPGTKIGISCRIWLTELPVGNPNLPGVAFRTPGNGDLYLFYINPNGSMSLFRDTDNTVLATTPTPIVFGGAWNHFEFIVNTATGAIEVYKEGVAVSSLTLTDPSPPAGSPSIGMITFFGSLTGGTGVEGAFIKDVYMYDGGGTQNNSQAGVLTILRLNPDSTVSSGWVNSDGTGPASTLLDKPGGVNDTTFISADDTPPAPAIMGIDNLPADIVGVRGLVMVSRMRKSDGGDANVQMSLSRAGNDDNGSDRTITTAFSYYWDVSELDPSTSAAWTPTGVNEATFKINRTV